MQIQLSSSDGVIFETDLRAAKMSSTISEIFEIGQIDTIAATIIPLPSIHSNILGKVLEWCERHRFDKVLTVDEQIAADRIPANFKLSIATLGEKDLKRRDNMSAWDIDFFDQDHKLISEVLHAAKDLGIPGLLRTSAKAMSNVMKDKSPTEIRTKLKLKTNFDMSTSQSIYADVGMILTAKRVSILNRLFD